jgi:ribosomal protein S25
MSRVELVDIMTTQAKRFDVILNEEIIKNINKDVTNIHIIFDFQRAVSK